MSDATPDFTPVTVYVSIGNSDDKLTQARWSYFVTQVDAEVRFYASTIHGAWHSLPNARWQNACWCIEVDGEHVSALREGLTDVRGEYGQDSIAWAVATTEFL